MILEDREHCPSWQQLYPPVSTTAITGTVLASDPQTRVIVLQDPVEGFVTVTLNPGSAVLSPEGEIVNLEAIAAGTVIWASGDAFEAGTLLAEHVEITSAIR